MILLDTHVLLWWISDPSRLSKKLVQLIIKSQNEKKLFISAISFWEIAMLHKKGRVMLAFDLDTWIQKVVSIQNLQLLDVNYQIFLKSVFLNEPFHPDPADRILVSTALNQGATLVTKDEKILSYPYVKTYWLD